MLQKWKQQSELYWIMIASVLLFGGFYDWAAALLGAAVCVMGIWRVKKTKRYVCVNEKWFLLIITMELCYIVSMITAVDKGMNLIGIVRFIPVVFWAILVRQYSKEERENTLNAIPLIGCITIIVGIIAFLIPKLRDWFWAAERLGGFFQYSNTCAIFFLLGMMLLDKKEDKISGIQWTILFWGILLTGSRVVMILLVCVLLVQLFQKKIEKPKKMLICINVLLAIIAAVWVVGLTGSYQNLARLATVFTSNSTFYGRLLYWKDALDLILHHPLGLGWKGYYYMQPAIQTGVYTTVYVHNDLLQCFLDGGWIAGVAFGSLMLWGLRTSKYKGMLAILLLHSIVDIDFQYISIWFIAILLFDFKEKTVDLRNEKKKERQLQFSMVALLCFYFLIPFTANFFEQYEMAIYLYPGYTQAKETKLATTGEIDVVEVLADEIINSNTYVSLAYDAKALAAYAKGDIRGFVEYKKRVLEIERFDITHYRDFDYLLKEFASEAKKNGDVNTVNYCEEQKALIPDMLKVVENQTSRLAWKIKDKPVFVIE